jgi:hypothetical protein
MTLTMRLRAVLGTAPDCRPSPRSTHRVWRSLHNQPLDPTVGWWLWRRARRWAQLGRVRVQGGPVGVKSDIGRHCPPTTRRKEDLNHH